MKLFDTLRQRWAERRRYLQTREELERLTGRELADIGITPYDFDRIARETARRG
jgi:uncharacterized protein YjiS (DUF1127 family)